MKTALFALLLVAAACDAPKPPVPEAGTPMEKNKAEKYVSGLQEDVKRAQEAKEKAEAANKKAQEAETLPE